MFIRHAAHGQNRHRNHKYHQNGIKCIGKIGVTVNHIVNHEINAHEHGHESNENIACHGAEIGFQLPLIDSSHWESSSFDGSVGSVTPLSSRNFGESSVSSRNISSRDALEGAMDRMGSR